jgi:DNA-binding protein H-NS
MKIIERIVNTETGETLDKERQLSSQELAERKESEAKFAAHLKEQEEKEAARQAIADRLGLTADELKILLG